MEHHDRPKRIIHAVNNIERVEALNGELVEELKYAKGVLERIQSKDEYSYAITSMDEALAHAEEYEKGREG